MQWVTLAKFTAAAIVAAAGLCWAAFFNRAAASVHEHLPFLQPHYIKPFAPAPRQVPGWMDLHNRLVQRARLLADEVDLLILGDSITEHVDGTAMGRPCCAAVKAAFEGTFRTANLTTATLAISGDQTPHLLWRLQHGEWPPTAPKVVLILIGTNDLGAVVQTGPGGLKLAGKRALATVLEIVKWVQAHSRPDTHVVLQGLLPRGLHLADHISYALPSIYSAPIADFNYDLWKHVRRRSGRLWFIDTSDAFLSRDGGSILPDLSPDALHPSGLGEAGMDAERAQFVLSLLTE